MKRENADEFLGAVAVSAAGDVRGLPATLTARLDQTNCGLRIEDGRLDGERSGRLRRVLTGPRQGISHLTLVFPTREPGTVMLARLESTAEASSHPHRLSFFLAGSQRLPKSDHVAVALGLSPAEAALAVALAQGRSPDEFAREKGVTKHTVRTQLADIRKKLGTRSQTQIANLVWLLAGSS